MKSTVVFIEKKLLPSKDSLVLESAVSSMMTVTVVLKVLSCFICPLLQ